MFGVPPSASGHRSRVTVMLVTVTLVARGVTVTRRSSFCLCPSCRLSSSLSHTRVFRWPPQPLVRDLAKETQIYLERHNGTQSLVQLAEFPVPAQPEDHGLLPPHEQFSAATVVVSALDAVFEPGRADGGQPGHPWPFCQSSSASAHVAVREGTINAAKVKASSVHFTT